MNRIFSSNVQFFSIKYVSILSNFSGRFKLLKIILERIMSVIVLNQSFEAIANAHPPWLQNSQFSPGSDISGYLPIFTTSGVHCSYWVLLVFMSPETRTLQGVHAYWTVPSLFLGTETSARIESNKNIANVNIIGSKEKHLVWIFEWLFHNSCKLRTHLHIEMCCIHQRSHRC